MNKLILVGFCALLLGGCSLSSLIPSGGESTTGSPIATTTPTPDSALESTEPVSSSSDATSLEIDLNNTVILDEDFSNLE